MDLAEQIQRLVERGTVFDVHVLASRFFFWQKQVVLGCLRFEDCGNYWTVNWTKSGSLWNGMNFRLLYADFNKENGHALLYSVAHDGYAVRRFVRGVEKPIRNLEEAKNVAQEVGLVIRLAYDQHCRGFVWNPQLSA